MTTTDMTAGESMTTKEIHRSWRERMTITVPEYAEIVGVGRNTAYESVRAGEVTIIKVRGRILVCVPPLLRKLGMAAE
jgi:hypothetical protein